MFKSSNVWRVLITVVIITMIANPAGATSLFTHGPNFSLSFNPGGGAQVGQDVNIHIKVDSANPGATKINVSCGGVSKGETSEVEFDSTWRTSDCPGGNANVNVCTKAPDDPNWQDPNCGDFGYSLSSAQQQQQPTNPPPPQQPSYGPSIQLSFDPGGGAQAGQDVNIHIRVNSNNPGAAKINVSCGSVSKGETSEVEFDSTWRTNGCSEGNANVNVCTKASDDPNWQNPNCNGYGYSLSAVQQNNPPPVARNPNEYFHHGDLIKTFSNGNVYVIIQEGSAIQIRLVPTWQTLDALGFSQNQVDNKDFSERELLKLGKGSDVPDVLRDPDGFRTFKATFFPNLAPIVHDQNSQQNDQNSQPAPSNLDYQEIPNGPQGLDSSGECPASPSVLNVGGYAVIARKDLNLRNKPNVNEANIPILAIPSGSSITVIDGPRCNQEVRWFFVEYNGRQGWAAEVGTGGEYHIYPVVTVQPEVPVVPPLVVVPQAEQPVAPQPLVEAPIETIEEPFFCSWWIVGWLACDLAEANSVDARTKPFIENQCTWYIANKTDRKDVWEWLPDTGADAKTWAQTAKNAGIPESWVGDPSFTIYDVQVGDIVVLQPNIYGAKQQGHVAYIESVDYANNSVHISEYNGPIVDKYSERNLVVIQGMSFIHKPKPVSQPQSVDACSKYSGFRKTLCKYFGWK